MMQGVPIAEDGVADCGGGAAAEATSVCGWRNAVYNLSATPFEYEGCYLDPVGTAEAAWDLIGDTYLDQVPSR
jgi:hypothetical protein